MDKQQGVLVAVGGVIVLGAAAFFWLTQAPEPAPAPAAPAAATTAITPKVSTPLGNGGEAALPAAPVSDAVALSEEPIDQYLQEAAELNSRASDLSEQVQDSATLIAMKEKQIRELEAQLKAIEAAKKPAP